MPDTMNCIPETVYTNNSVTTSDCRSHFIEKIHFSIINLIEISFPEMNQELSRTAITMRASPNGHGSNIKKKNLASSFCGVTTVMVFRVHQSDLLIHYDHTNHTPQLTQYLLFYSLLLIYKVIQKNNGTAVLQHLNT